MQELVRPFFERMEMVAKGDAQTAINTKPSGIWYANDYAKALAAVGDGKVLVRGKEYPASGLLAKLKEIGAFYAIKAPGAYWENVSSDDPRNAVGKEYMVLKMKDGVVPSEAMESFSENLSLIDCASTLRLAMTLTLMDVIGKKRFNALPEFEKPFFFGAQHERYNTSSLDRFMKPMKYSVKEGETVSPPAGMSFYRAGPVEYDLKHLHGSGCGFALLSMGDGKFLGLGLDPDGETYDQIGEELLKEFNETPMDGREVLTVEATVRMFESIPFQVGSEAGCMTFTEIEEAAAGLPAGMSGETVAVIRALDAERVKIVDDRTKMAAMTLTKEAFDKLPTIPEGMPFQMIDAETLRAELEK